MNPIFNQIGIAITPENKKEIDKKIHSLVGIEYKNCSATWKAIKERLAADEERFISDLDKVLGQI